MNRFMFCVRLKDQSILFGTIKAKDVAEARIELERIWRDRDIDWLTIDLFGIADKDFDYKWIKGIKL